jgi:alpha-tubulin suppressor-like RCC1 family protein
MDSDLETAINNGYVSESYNDLPGTLYTGDNSTTTTTTTADNTTTYLYNFEDGVVPSNFSMSGNADWGVTSSNKASGSYSLKSGSIVHSQTSCVSLTQTTIAGPLVFYYKTSSESSDKLKFYLDGSVNKTFGASGSFTKYSATVSSSGSHTFKWCYEKDSYYSSGDDTVWIDEILMPLETTNFSSVSAGQGHTCAVDNYSGLFCWGGGGSGRLGNGSTNNQTTPVSVDNVSTATSVSAGYSHTCAVLSGGTVKCWGNDSSTTNSSTPVSVSNITTATSVSAGRYHSCALLSGGTVKCWGNGGYGQLGSGSTSNSSTPVSVDNVSTATSVSAGEYHTCAVLSGGTAKCWGYGQRGQLGNGSTSNQSSPVSVDNITTATSVSAGDSHTCAVLSGGTVKCWGDGQYGQLGNGSTSNQSSPVSADNITTATSVSAGANHSCALLSGGTVKCWGYGNNGQLGNGSTSNSSTPVSVDNVTTANSVSAGGYHTCAVLSGGTVKCWGYGNSGQLGNGSTSNQSSSVSVNVSYTDQSGPTGSILINNKPSYSYGKYNTVSLTLNATDSTAIVSYTLSSGTTYVTQTTSLSLSVTESKYLSNGNNSFSVSYMDVLGNTSTYSDTVYCSSSSCY